MPAEQADREALRERVRALELENRQLREQLDGKAKVATRALAAYQQRVERLAETLSRLEERDRRLSEDLEEARRFQSLLLVRPAQLSGLEVATLYQPCQVVGGDVYQVVTLPDGRVRVFIADASGHGVQAAMRTMILKSEYDRLRGVMDTPSALLEALNDRLVAAYPSLELRSSAACLDLVPHPEGYLLRYASCAHPDLLVAGADGNVERVYQAGPFLAATPGIRLATVERRISKGSRVALYTDGLVEEWDPSGAVFGLDPLLEALRRPGPIAETIAALDTRLMEFVGARGLSDDATVLAIDVRA